MPRKNDVILISVTVGFPDLTQDTAGSHCTDPSCEEPSSRSCTEPSSRRAQPLMQGGIENRKERSGRRRPVESFRHLNYFSTAAAKALLGLLLSDLYIRQRGGKNRKFVCPGFEMAYPRNTLTLDSKSCGERFSICSSLSFRISGRVAP